MNITLVILVNILRNMDLYGKNLSTSTSNEDPMYQCEDVSLGSIRYLKSDLLYRILTQRYLLHWWNR